MSSGIIGGDPSSLPSQTCPPDSPNTPESSENATNLSVQSPTGGLNDQNASLNDQNASAGTPVTNGLKAGPDHPRSPQPSDEISMELADFDELKAKVEEQRERSVQTFHAISGALDSIHAEVQYIYSEFLTQQYHSIEYELGRLHEESNRRLQEQERLQQQLAQFLATMMKAFSIFE
ncbi:hypothetical protein BG006_001361 [Podila minutissima]|uniref:Uncharacterized protein n=1 Tax=Podila minutissima TaxID=64525 RepID=A0A9P5VH45_9FUNG|nr:hypothetical protein BG006_001361 [Podila minutissima]